MHTSWGMALVEVQESLKEDSSVPIGGGCRSPSGLLHLHTISSFFITFFSIITSLSIQFFFSAAYFLLFSLSTPLIPLQYLPVHFPLSLPSASISFCSPHFESVILPSPSILSQVSPSLISLPCLAYLPRACIVSVSITDSVAVAHSPGHWGLQWCWYSFQFSNQGVILQLVNGQQ